MQKFEKGFRQLVVWQESKQLCLFIYKNTKQFPSDERFALTSQIRRASYSVMANIAEGNERKCLKDRLNFFNMAKSSLVELDCFFNSLLT